MDWPATFAWEGRQLYYNTNSHNNLAERVVEIPIVFDWLCQHSLQGRSLEVGNVLQYYENGCSDRHLNLRSRLIVDKFERARGVTNCDIFDLSPAEPFDCIISISTLEHVGQGIEWQGGYGETRSRDRFAPLKAIAHLYDLLSPGGKALITVPWGKVTDFGWMIQFGLPYLQCLHTHLGLPTDAVSCQVIRKLTMASEGDRSLQQWQQCPPKAASNVEFNSPWQYANAMACLTLTQCGERSKERSLTEESVPIEFAPPVVIGGVLQHDFNINAQITGDRILNVTEPGAIFHGPYKRLNAGRYAIEVLLQSEFPLALDVCIDSGNTVLLAQDLKPNVSTELKFVLPHDSDIEIRVHNNHAGQGKVRIDTLALRWLSQPV